MELSVKPPPSEIQDTLFDLPPPDKVLETPGASRTHYGRTVELAVESLMGLEDIVNSGTFDVVYDAYHRESEKFCEIKSVFASSSIPLYDWRRKKDRATKLEPVYIIGLHRTRNAETLREVWEGMGETMREILVVPFRVIDRMAPKYSLKQLVKEVKGTRMGYQRKGYCKGYRLIPASHLRRCRFKPPVTLSSEIEGVAFNAKLLVHTGLDWEPESFLRKE